MSESEKWVAVIGEQAFGTPQFDTHLEGVPGTPTEGRQRRGLKGVGYLEAAAWARARAGRIDVYVQGDVYSVGRVDTADARRATDDEMLELIQSGPGKRVWHVALTPPPGVTPQIVGEALGEGAMSEGWTADEGVVRFVAHANDPDDLDYEIADLLAAAGLRDVRVTINSSSP